MTISRPVVDLIVELKKRPDDELIVRAVEEIQRLRGVIARNSEIRPETSHGDQWIIETCQQSVAAISN